MGRYRARDLVNVPTLVSWLRLPLAAAFPFVLFNPALSVAVLAAAAISDVVDGYVARRFGLATATGAVVDGATDKAFAAVVLASLVATNKLGLVDVALLGTRELFEVPLVLWVAVSRSARRRKIDDRANTLGKIATALQSATILAVLVGSGYGAVVTAGLVATAAVGAASGVSYWRRALASRVTIESSPIA